VATFVDRHARPKAPAMNTPDEILRFRVCERHLHWAIAIPFKICYLTAVTLVLVYNPSPARPYRDVFAWIHRLSGICLATLPPLMLFIHRREFGMHLRNVREAWSWRFDDLKWLLLMGPATLSKKVALPHQGKFNAAEKINFMVVLSTYPIYIATGLAIWFLRPAYVSWMVHFSMAMAATPLVIGHIFMATVNPDTRVGLKGMISGWVSREWAQHHYRYWYDEHFGQYEHPAHAAASAVPAPSAPPALPASADLRPVPAIQPAAVLPAAALRTVSSLPPQSVAAATRPPVPALSISAQPSALTPRVSARPQVSAGAAADRPPTARPAKVLWPPDASAADPSFAS
jgi:formate dehydrogenase subunit gamma